LPYLLALLLASPLCEWLLSQSCNWRFDMFVLLYRCGPLHYNLDAIDETSLDRRLDRKGSLQHPEGAGCAQEQLCVYLFSAGQPDRLSGVYHPPSNKNMGDNFGRCIHSKDYRLALLFGVAQVEGDSPASAFSLRLDYMQIAPDAQWRGPGLDVHIGAHAAMAARKRRPLYVDFFLLMGWDLERAKNGKLLPGHAHTKLGHLGLNATDSNGL
jgi:hypothetical protein